MKSKIIKIDDKELALKFGYINQKKFEEKFEKPVIDTDTRDPSDIPKLIWAGQTDTSFTYEEILNMIDNSEICYNESVKYLSTEVFKAILLSFTGKETLDKTVEESSEKN